MSSRLALVATMVVLREPGEVFLLCHSGGDQAVSWVELIDPETLESVHRSRDLEAGPTWPGGIAAHANGLLYVVFGRFVHQLSASLEVLRSKELPRDRPYNSLVILSSGELVMKDFGGARPGEDSEWRSEDCELVVLDPLTLEILDSKVLPEASVARLSADGREIFVVGVTTLFRLVWDGDKLIRSPLTDVVYVSEEGQGYGWDAVVTNDHVWFLDNGAGSEKYAGSLLGCGLSSTGQKLIQVSRATGQVFSLQVNEEPRSIVANPPAIDVNRNIAIGYDSAHGVVQAFDFSEGENKPIWRTSINHAMHPILASNSGVVMLNDFDVELQRDYVVFLYVTTGEPLHRIETQSPLQSVLFAAGGFKNDVYVCSFSHVTRIAFDSD